MTHINHITVQRKEVKWNPDGGIEKEIYLQFKKPRRPRKWKKRFLNRFGYKWNKNIISGWILDDEAYYPLSQSCKENN